MVVRERTYDRRKQLQQESRRGKLWLTPQFPPSEWPFLLCGSILDQGCACGSRTIIKPTPSSSAGYVASAVVRRARHIWS